MARADQIFGRRAEIALSLVLLTGAGLLLRSLKQLYAVSTGYERDQVVTMWVFPALDGYEHAREMELYQQLLDQLNAVPAVQSASLSRLMLVNGNWYRSAWIQGATRPLERKVYCDPIGPRFFQTMGIRLLLGREFSARDTETSQKVAIISESMARQSFPGQNPLGRRIGFDGASSDADVEVVGVVKDIKHRVDRQETSEAAWIPYTQAPPDMFGQMVFLVRTAAPGAALTAAMRSAAQSLDKTLPLGDIQPQSAEVDEYLGPWRSMSMLLSFFGGLTLLLASLGLYGAMTYLVRRRSKELGIRFTLGAQKAEILWMVLREAVLLALAGIAIGLPAAVVSGRLISSMLFGVGMMDPVTMLSVVVTMCATALLAAYLPARRATRTDPVVTLRYE